MTIHMRPVMRNIIDSIFEEDLEIAPEARVHIRSIQTKPGCHAWQIVGEDYDDVQSEINTLMNHPTVQRSEFYNPKRVIIDNKYQWRARGYTIAHEEMKVAS
jgi:hypothetical protein